MVSGNGVKNIQAAAYNGARTVCSTFVKLNWTYFRTSILLYEAAVEIQGKTFVTIIYRTFL